MVLGIMSERSIRELLRCFSDDRRTPGCSNNGLLHRRGVVKKKKLERWKTTKNNRVLSFFFWLLMMGSSWLHETTTGGVATLETKTKKLRILAEKEKKILKRWNTTNLFVRGVCSSWLPNKNVEPARPEKKKKNRKERRKWTCHFRTSHWG